MSAERYINNLNKEDELEKLIRDGYYFPSPFISTLPEDPNQSIRIPNIPSLIPLGLNG